MVLILNNIALESVEILPWEEDEFVVVDEELLELTETTEDEL